MKVLKKDRKKSPKLKESGLLTIDFIFSFLVTWGIMSMFLLLSFTLMISSVSQYIVFAVNRTYISGHINPEVQSNLGDQKFQTLVQSFGRIISTGDDSWFKLTLNQQEAQEPFQNVANQFKFGKTVTYKATVLTEAEFPILGGLDGGNDGANFGQATLKAYMYREPSTQECIDFNTSRWQKILEKFSNLNVYIEGADPYGSSSDNGC